MPRRLQSWSDKPLPTRVPVPTNTAIGRQIASLVPAGAVRLGRSEERGVEVVETTDTFDLNGDGRADARLRTTSRLGVVDRVMLEVERPAADRRQAWFAPGNGKVDSFFDGNDTNGTWTRDEDRDGRVDAVLMTGADMGSFTLDGHTGRPIDDRGQPIPVESGKLPAAIFARGFDDTDGDGSFDQEFVGGPWWIKEQ
ncbi:MAG: hypothetical protein Q8L48_32070 [Archangium sp.]|nr:hypothetical protein [Archangium sp.]